MILIVALALCVVVAAGLAVYSNFLPGSEVGTSATSTPTDNPPPAGTTVTPSEGTSTGTTAPATTQQQ
ncbi:hypothetical protein ASG48_15470 [Aurantimonas sp. Leaf443]|nr:hypothetical protein ASG48_15470 [Aurantimonas sp. Leaf443]